MTRTIVLTAVALIGSVMVSHAQFAAGTLTQKSPLLRCLPASISWDDVVTYRPNGSRDTKVASRIKELKARCVKGWTCRSARPGNTFLPPRMLGSPPADYREILDPEQHKLTKLKKRYTVVELGCSAF